MHCSKQGKRGMTWEELGKKEREDADIYTRPKPSHAELNSERPMRGDRLRYANNETNPEVHDRTQGATAWTRHW